MRLLLLQKFYRYLFYLPLTLELLDRDLDPMMFAHVFFLIETSFYMLWASIWLVRLLQA